MFSQRTSLMWTTRQVRKNDAVHVEQRPIDRLIVDISRCPNIDICLSGRDRSHPCYDVVNSQAVGVEDFHLPEPWRGDLVNAPILFVSSNPSVSHETRHPTRSWSEVDVVDYYNNSFNGHWVKDDRFYLLSNGNHGGPAKYWSLAKNSASELLGREAKGGSDYALTEVVHCKSKNDFVIGPAIRECADRHLYRVLEHSAARVIAVQGRKAAQAFEGLVPSTAFKSFHEVEIAGKLRNIVFMGGPGPAPQSKKFATVLPASELLRWRKILAEGTSKADSPSTYPTQDRLPVTGSNWSRLLRKWIRRD